MSTQLRLLFLLITVICPIAAWSQIRPVTGNNNTGDFDSNNPLDPTRRGQDSVSVEIISLPPKLYQWKLSRDLGNILSIPVDTAAFQFQNSNLTEGVDGHYNHLGNMGAPRLSRVFFDRPMHGSTLFLEPFDDFATGPYDFIFTNSNIPFTNITYYKTFNSQYGEDRFKPYFSVNANKRLAFGFNFDYLYGRGYYQWQATAYMKGALFGSYVGNRYQMHAIFNFMNMKMQENGGLTDIRYVTDPEATGESRPSPPQTMPTQLSGTYNYNNGYYGFLTQRYNVGFYRELPKDSTQTDSIVHKEYVPVTSFIHTAHLESSKHRLIYGDADRSTGYLPEISNTPLGQDSTIYTGIKNTLGIALLEGFNKYAKAGLTAYASHKMSIYDLMSTSSTTKRYTEHEVYIGGELQKKEGKTLHYRAKGEIGIAGAALGQFRINGDADVNVRLGKQNVSLIGRASISNTTPAFYMRRYYSNHYEWDNNFNKEFRTRLEGELNIAHTRTNLMVGVENINNYTYFDSIPKPAQYGGSIQVLTARLRQNFKLGVFHLDNEVIWQKSSNETTIPLPQLNLYHNLYIQTTYAKVLHIQLGADVRYFTAYYAPAYAPGIQQFHLQSPTATKYVYGKIGNYPIVNAYANLQLKRTRFFVMMYHVNQGISDPNYFLVPNYPINQRLLKFGISWNFYD